MKFIFISLSLLLLLLLDCAHCYTSPVGCSKSAPKKLGLSSLPQYNVDQAFCLSATKMLVNSQLRSSVINAEGELENTYQFEWLIRLCNECPQYNIYNISAIDTISVSELISTDTQNLTIAAILLTPRADSPNAQNFTINSLPASCSSIDTANNSKSISCSLFGCPSSLPSYSTIDCHCTPDRGCADFNLTVISVIRGSSPNVCPSYSGNVGNCIYANGTICSQYSNNAACTNCVPATSREKRFSPHAFNHKLNGIGEGVKSVFSNLFNGEFKGASHKQAQSVDLPSLFPDLFPVCGKSCAPATPISYVPSPQQLDFSSNVVCSLSNDQCTDGRCPSQSCNSAVFDCAWVLRDYSSIPNQPFNFSVSLPFLPIVLSPECVVDSNDPSGTTVLCGVTSNTQFPLHINGTYCVEKEDTCTNITITSTTSDIITGGCNNVVIEDVETILVIPPTNITTLTKSAIDYDTGEVLDAIDCTDPSVSSTLVYYRITVAAPLCGPLNIRFNDVGQYPIDTTFGVTGLLVSDPDTLLCSLNGTNGFECHTEPSSLLPGQVITVIYRVNVACSLCNTFDSAACVNNVASNNLTNIQVESLTCPLNVPGELSFLTPIVCPCPVCDCSVTLPTFPITVNSTSGVYLKPAGGQNFFNNYLSCSVVNDNGNYAVPVYTSPIYGWFIHYGKMKWACDPFNSTDNTLTAQMPLVTGNYTISCCAYQNTKNFIGNDPVADVSIKSGDPVKFLYYHNDGSQIGAVQSTFTCTNEALSTSFPSHFPIFRKVVG